MQYYLAIDIGASSGRHIVGWKEGSALHTEEVHRFHNGVTNCDGHLLWDVEHLVKEIKSGLAKAIAAYGKLESLSIDTWGVDYVRLRGNESLQPCFAYRDNRTANAIKAVHEIVPFSELYRRTGCQFQPFTSIYQWYDDLCCGRLEGVTDILAMPEYLMYRLTGKKVREYTHATTTGLVDPRTGEFDLELVEKLGLPVHLFPKLSPPGTEVGALLPEVAQEVGGSCRVVLCATHDTASAVEGIPMEKNAPYISSGTWSLLGMKTPEAITSAAAEQANFSNEGGVGYNRFQKNIMGMWLVNELRRDICPELPFPEITELACASQNDTLVDANSDAFLSPNSMKSAFDEATGNALKTPGDYFRCAYRSLAQCYKTAIEELERGTGIVSDTLYIVGGGAKNEYLNGLTREVTGKHVIALPIEATALGNLKIQMERA